MTVNWKRALTWIIALIVLFAIIVGVKQVFFSSPSVTVLMMDTITLSGTNDTVKRAALITSMDESVAGLKNAAIAAQWSTLTDCIAGTVCTQDDYFDFLLIIAMEKNDDVPHAQLIADVIIANRYWGNAEKIIEFSKALSSANEEIELLGLKTVRNKWQEIVYCDGKCPEFHQQFFEFIRLLLTV